MCSTGHIRVNRIMEGEVAHVNKQQQKETSATAGNIAAIQTTTGGEDLTVLASLKDEHTSWLLLARQHLAELTNTLLRSQAVSWAVSRACRGFAVQNLTAIGLDL